MNRVPGPRLLSLDDPRATDPQQAGGKAARLAALVQAGHPVPPGFVLTVDGLRGDLAPGGELALALDAALAALDGPVAVRSSGLAEDLAEASFAGQYETVLDVVGTHAVLAAVQRCLASAASERVQSYQAERGLDAASMAVLVQRMVPARAAGVAFTADPVTGARDRVIVSAVRGLGEGLVSGTADAEEWEVQGGQVQRRREAGGVLTEAQVRAVAGLALAVADGQPTDIEWALSDRLQLLQARPMTALPEPLRWDPPAPGGWARHFRLGEWIGAPLSPLFETWLLADLERGMHARFEFLFGIQMPRPEHVVVNGWYFYGLNQPQMGLGALWTMLRNVPSHWREMAALTPPVAHLGFESEVQRWRDQLLPAWQATVDDARARVDQVPLAELPALVDAVIAGAAVQAASLVGVSGYAAKAEWKLATFCKAHGGERGDAWLDLVTGGEVRPAAHDVEGLDWMLPTLGERGPLPEPPSAEARARLAARRDAAEAALRAALSPRLQARLDPLLAAARRAHVLRQEQTGLFTLGWPVMRRALARIGEALVARGALSAPAELYFLRREELQALLDGGTLAPPLAARRAEWARQNRLVPPLVIGELTGMFKETFAQMEAFLHHEEHDAPDALVGMPGSPGRVSGPARVIRSLDELHRLLPGEILVAPVTTPGWTPAFAKALAIVTDTGSIASHASIVAREHGIPAVVGTGAGTGRIHDGQWITVDGGRGLVRLMGGG